MKNKNYYLATGALLCSTIAGVISPMSSTFAEGASSYFDENAISCIIDSYNTTNGTSVTTFEEVDYDKVTTLNCSNRNITNFRGIVLFKNLKNLSLTNNTSLEANTLDFSQNTKLESLALYNVKDLWSVNLSHNPELKAITIGPETVYITFPQGVEKLDNGKYGIKLDNYKWYDSDMTGLYTITIDESSYPYTLDEETNQIIFEDKTKIPYSVLFSNSHGTFRVNSRTGWMRYAVFLNGNESIETHNPLYVSNNCKEQDGYYDCNNSIYSGDTLDTEDIVENTLNKIFNLSGYKLSEVKIVPPTANVELATNTDTIKKGTVLADADFTLEFHFGLQEEVKAPNTGAFTMNDGGLIASASVATISLASIAIYFVYYAMNRQKSKVSLGKK